MVSKNNQWQKRQKEMQTVQHFGIRKLTVGVSTRIIFYGNGRHECEG